MSFERQEVNASKDEKMNILQRLVVSGALCAVVTGCANINTLARSSSTPMTEGRSKAVHLDAQQRLVVFTALKYCAEPSPDALAAYAAAIGLSGSKLPGQSAAASAALNSVAGSIGLRTQSITLMRDTLYRNCEAALNGYLSHEQVAVLMSRSQDLTAVILAIEQLTGAVAAPPVTLNTGGNSSAASTLMANTEALKVAEDVLAKLKKERDDAEKKKDDLLTTLNQRKAEADAARKAASTDASKDGEAKEKEHAYDLASKDFDVAKENFERMSKHYTHQQETTAQIKSLRDSSVNLASAGTSGSAETGSVIVHSSRMTDTKELATTVDKMIERYLHKDYFADACISRLLRPGITEDIRASIIDKEGRNAFQSMLKNKDSSVPADTRPKILAETDNNQRALSYLCLRYFAQFKPHYGQPDGEKPIQPPPSPPTASSADAYSNETAKEAKKILDGTQ